MDSLKDFENDLNKCSKCGLCQQACPIFQLTQNECTVSKGKFIMLYGAAKGDLKLSKTINKYIDMCLKCGKCNKFCPSGIDVCKILNTAKYEYSKNKLISKIIHILQSRLFFSNFINIFKILTHPFRPRKNNIPGSEKILYFKGCVNQICPRTDNYLDKIFKNSPINIIEPDFDCCGLPFLSEGNLKRFEQCAKHNTSLLNTDYDYLVTDCASCQSTISEYSKYINSPEIPKDKNLNWGDIIAQKDIHFKFNKKITVTFHKPCHLENDAFFEKIIGNCENVNYIKMENYDSCCGLAGSFGVKNPKLSKELSIKKAENILKTKADFVITTCPVCLIGLKQGLRFTKSNTKVISLLEFLAKADNITN